jgi:hypothetical protein
LCSQLVGMHMFVSFIPVLHCSNMYHPTVFRNVDHDAPIPLARPQAVVVQLLWCRRLPTKTKTSWQCQKGTSPWASPPKCSPSQWILEYTSSSQHSSILVFASSTIYDGPIINTS